MKKYFMLLLSCVVFAFLSSCVETTPNDRATYNLQGAVKQIVTTDMVTGKTETIDFTAKGFRKIAKGERPLHTTYEYRKVTIKDDSLRQTFLYEFDSDGRLEWMVQSDSAQSPARQVSLHYDYSGKDRQAESVEVEIEHPLPGEQEDEFAIETQLDEHLNWTEIKYGDVHQTRKIDYYPTTAPVNNCPMERQIDWISLVEFLGLILLLGSMLYMLYDIFHQLFLRPMRKTTYTVEEFQKKRQGRGATKDASNEENERANGLLQENLNLWEPIITEDTQEKMSMPMTTKEINTSDNNIAKIVEICPTDSDVVLKLNAHNEILNDVEKRTFSGSKTFIIVTAIIALIAGFAFDAMDLFYYLLGSIIFYTLASMMPEFMILSKGETTSKSPKMMTGVMGMIFGMFTTAKVYNVTTKWNDGTTTHSKDWTEKAIGFVLMILAAILMACLMSLISIMSYLRNYVFYK